MDNAIIGSILRHIGSIIAGILISKGIATEGHSEEIIGAVIAIGTMIWSQYQKAQQKKAVEIALKTEPPK